MSRPLLLLALTALVFGCTRREGNRPGECTDGVDNDRDGWYDCEDQDCWGHPDCGGRLTDPREPRPDPSDTGDTDDTDDTGDTDEPDDPQAPHPALQPLRTATVDYTLAFAFDLPTLGLDNCDVVFRGEGPTRREVVGTRITFDGTWAAVGGSCPEVLRDVVWTSAGLAHHSFIFDANVGRLDAWFAHAEPDGHTTEASDVWYMTELEASFDSTAAAPAVTWTGTERLPNPPGTLTHDLSIRFTK